jgi:hypothetical protein
MGRGVLKIGGWPHYRWPLLEALSGLILVPLEAVLLVTWVARLHEPFFHFREGSGHEAQYQPEASSTLRPQPLQLSVTWWQLPPL